MRKNGIHPSRPSRVRTIVIWTFTAARSGFVWSRRQSTLTIPALITCITAIGGKSWDDPDLFPWEHAVPGRLGIGETQETVFRVPKGRLATDPSLRRKGCPP